MKKLVLGAVIAGFILSTSQVHAEDPIASKLSTSEAEEYVGIWQINLNVMDFEIELFLTFSDVEGQLGATLDTKQSPEPLAISNIDKIDERLDLNSELNFAGAITLDVNINVGLEDGKLVGSLADKGGLIKTEFEATRIEAEELDSVQGKRPDPTETRMNIEGKRVRIQFARLEMDTTDRDLFEGMKAGDVQRFTLSRATKLYTDFDLDFDGTVVKTANYADDYPGVYSLWLKKTESGWSLVFNSWPDIWGTSYDAEFDVAEVPLTLGKVEGESLEKFVMKLDPTDGGGDLTMAWGMQQWSTSFKLGNSL